LKACKSVEDGYRRLDSDPRLEFFKKTEKLAHPGAKNPVLSPDEDVFAMVGGYLFRRGKRFKMLK
jgi:hypothetical protein